MNRQLEKMLADLGINIEWVSSGTVDQTFVNCAHSELEETSPEHVRTSFYAKFFSDRKKTGIPDKDIATYLSLVEKEQDELLRSWAIGFLIESNLLSLEQLKKMRVCSLLENKHRLFLEREINEKQV